MVKPRRKGMTQEQVTLLHGVRSGLEKTVSEELVAKCIEYEYEKRTLAYKVPESAHKYTPDFYLPASDIYVETKGMWEAKDRQKMLLVIEQHPDLDIRMVFSRSKTKIYPGSPTTYGSFCEKHGIAYADKTIPQDWITPK